MKHVPEIHEFFVEGGSPERSHALLHITEPSTPKEEPRGYFFAVAEVVNGSTECIEHLQTMIDDLESGYYESDADDDKDPFETALEFINRRGHQMLTDTKTSIHCIIGVLRGEGITFAYHGEPSALLFYTGKNGLDHVNILDGEEQTGRQLFSALMQGKMNPGDYFFLATPRVIDHVNADTLTDLFVQTGTEASAAEIQKTVHRASGNHSFAGVVFHIPKPPERTAIAPPHATSDQSIHKLRAAEQEAEALLSPPLFGDAKRKIQSLMHDRHVKPIPADDSEETNVRTTKQRPSESLPGTILIAFGRALVVTALGIWRVTQSIFIGIVHGIAGIGILLTNRGNRRRDMILRWKRALQLKKQAFRSLPFLSKILFIATILFALSFISSIGYLKLQARHEQALVGYNNLVQSIRDRKEAAEGSLIYGNETKAFELLREANDLLATIPQDTDAQKEVRNLLANEIETSLQRMRKVSVVSPELLTDLSTVREGVKATRLARIDDAVIAYGDEDTFLYRTDLVTKKIDTHEHNTITKLHTASTPKEQDMILFASGEQGIAKYQKENNTLSTADISFPNPSGTIQDLFVYNQRLYALDRVNKAIYRHNKTQSGYDKGTVWNKDGSDNLATAVAMAIDGDMFVLTDTGIVKFAAGSQQAFEITGLDPALDHPTAIWTYNDVNNIYILEPKNKRLIVLNKTGKLLSQYTAKEWQNPTDMVIDEAKKTAYIIDQNKIYQFSF